MLLIRNTEGEGKLEYAKASDPLESDRNNVYRR